MALLAYSQRDARWAATPLGTGQLTIGEAGCLLTACASLLASWGVSTDPGRLNEFVKRSFGFVDDNLFVFASVDGLACRFVEYISCYHDPAPVERLSAAIGAGAGVLACVDFTPGGKLQQHWVWLTELTTQGGQVVDPWQLPGQEVQPLSQYLAAGWTPARGIFAAALYSRIEERRAVAWRAAIEAVQPGVCVRGGQDAE